MRYHRGEQSQKKQKIKCLRHEKIKEFKRKKEREKRRKKRNEEDIIVERRESIYYHTQAFRSTWQTTTPNFSEHKKQTNKCLYGK